ncbi:MAG: hypothetical protein AAGH17_02465 [Pseudomonadota bacterium]
MAVTTSSGCRSRTTFDPMLAARIRAGLREGGISVLLTSPFLLVLLSDSAEVPLVIALWLTIATTCAPVINLARARLCHLSAPDHAALGLHISGHGCHMCRLLRFWLPIAVTPAAACLASLNGNTSIPLLAAAATALHLISGARAIAQGREPHWCAATGFTVRLAS